MRTEKTVSSKSKIRHLKVTKESTLLQLLQEVFPEKSKTSIKSFLSHKQVEVNGRFTSQFDLPVRPNDNVSVYLDPKEKRFSHAKLSIMYEDETMIVIEKKEGLLSMSTVKHAKSTEESAYKILSDYLKKKGSKSRVYLVHRLDRETSGVMMFVKDLEVQQWLKDNWNQAILDRRYVAVVYGVPQKNEGRVQSYLTENKAFEMYETNPEDGKLAITNYRVLQTNGEFSLVELQLETGRKNQIRVHLKQLGTPVVGDYKYGSRQNLINRLGLHACKLSFTHPITQEVMSFETAIPGKFKRLLK